PPLAQPLVVLSTGLSWFMDEAKKRIPAACRYQRIPGSEAQPSTEHCVRLCLAGQVRLRHILGWAATTTSSRGRRVVGTQQVETRRVRVESCEPKYSGHRGSFGLRSRSVTRAGRSYADTHFVCTSSNGLLRIASD